MRAIILDGRTPRLTACERPEAGPGEAVIASRRAVVSGLEIAVVRAGGFDGVLGHAFTGTVERVRGDDAGVAGERVVCSIVTRCGACDLCHAGLRWHCRERGVLGVERRDGGLAECVCVPAENLLRVPPGIDDDHAAFVAPVAAALNAARHLAIERRPYITVLGDGVLGLITVQVMAALNATVRLIGRHAEKLALCERWGVKHRLFDEIGLRADQDIVVECTGRPDGLEAAARLVRPRGTILAMTPFEPAVPVSSLVRGEVKIVGSFGFPVGDALAAIATGEIDVVSLISRRMNLSDGPAILEAAARPDVLAVIVDCTA
jgi:threonine dehydrogenase-like Zn-dependent dehydrogenase